MALILLTSSTHHLSPFLQEKGHDVYQIESDMYGDGEFYFKDQDKIKALCASHGSEGIYLIHGTCPPVHDNSILLLLLLDYLSQLGVKVHLFVPYLGYARQSMDVMKSMGRLFDSTCLEKICFLDVHQPGLQPLFSAPVEEISVVSFFSSHLKSSRQKPFVLVAADKGGKNRVKQLADALDVPFICLLKNRGADRSLVFTPLTEEDIALIKGHHLIIVDDMIDSGGTILQAAEMLKKEGALSIEVVVTHGVFSGQALQKLDNDVIKRITVTNSIYHDQLPSKIQVVDMTSCFDFSSSVTSRTVRYK